MSDRFEEQPTGRIYPMEEPTRPVQTGESLIDATPQGEPTRPLTDFDRRAWALMGSQEMTDKPAAQEEPLPPEVYEEEDEFIDEHEERDYMPIRFRRDNRLGCLGGLMYAAFVICLSIVLACVAWMAASDVLALNKEYVSAEVTIPDTIFSDKAVDVTDENGEVIGRKQVKAADMNVVARLLQDQGIVNYKWLFKLYSSFSNADEKIDPGTYELNEVFDYRALVYGMVETGENRATETVTVPEGYELDDIFELLEEKQVCDAASLRQAAAEYEFDYWFLEGMPYGDYRRLEGYLYPDTYEFYLHDNPENVLSKFLRNFDVRVTDEMRADLDNLNKELQAIMAENGFTEAEVAASGLTFHDVVIVASLVEKETSGAAESGRIASVIYNRLCSKLYPCLNLDSTIQYVLPERKDVLTNADKAVISPYNTYTNTGLPKGPISNPGMSSLRAALYPVDTDYYFFALEPGGTHHFSETVYEHQQYLDILMGSNLEPVEETEETN